MKYIYGSVVYSGNHDLPWTFTYKAKGFLGYKNIIKHDMAFTSQFHAKLYMYDFVDGLNCRKGKYNEGFTAN